MNGQRESLTHWEISIDLPTFWAFKIKKKKNSFWLGERPPTFSPSYVGPAVECVRFLPASCLFASRRLDSVESSSPLRANAHFLSCPFLSFFFVQITRRKKKNQCQVCCSRVRVCFLRVAIKCRDSRDPPNLIWNSKRSLVNQLCRYFSVPFDVWVADPLVGIRRRQNSRQKIRKRDGWMARSPFFSLSLSLFFCFPFLLLRPCSPRTWPSEWVGGNEKERKTCCAAAAVFIFYFYLFASFFFFFFVSFFIIFFFRISYDVITTTQSIFFLLNVSQRLLLTR